MTLQIDRIRYTVMTSWAWDRSSWQSKSVGAISWGGEREKDFLKETNMWSISFFPKKNDYLHNV